MPPHDMNIFSSYFYAIENGFVYQQALIVTEDVPLVFWLQSSLCEFTKVEHKFKRWFCTQKPALNVRFKYF
jgi:hypothetical protein